MFNEATDACDDSAGNKMVLERTACSRAVRIQGQDANETLRADARDADSKCVHPQPAVPTSTATPNPYRDGIDTLRCQQSLLLERRGHVPSVTAQCLRQLPMALQRCVMPRECRRRSDRLAS